jgi:hypothetical protein
MSEDSGPTIGDLAKHDLRLGLYCATCARFRYMRGNAFADDEPVKTIAKNLVCATCRSSDLSTRPVRRDFLTGRWPAESS